MSATSDPVVLLLVCGVALGLGVLTATLVRVGGDRSQALAEAPAPPRRGDSRTRRLDSALAASPALRRAVALTANLAERGGALGSLERSLRAADVPVRPAEVMLAHAVATVVVPIVTFALTQSTGKAVLAFVLAGIGPPYALRFMTKRRRKKFGNQLPDALTTLAGSLRAGRSIGQAMEALSREKLLVPVASPSYKDLVPGAVPKHQEWAVAQITLFAVAYNTNLIKKEELPRSYKDLLDPKWKGKLGVEGTDYDWLSIVTDHFGGEAGVRMFRDIKERNGLSVRTGHSLTANMVASGEVPMALNVYQYKAVQLKREGAPVDWFILEPTLAFSTGIGVLRNAMHPNAALLFHEYMLTEGQEVMAALDDVPSNTKVKSPLKNDKIQFIDPNTALDNRVKRETLFNDVIVK